LHEASDFCNTERVKRDERADFGNTRRIGHKKRSQYATLKVGLSLRNSSMATLHGIGSNSTSRSAVVRSARCQIGRFAGHGVCLAAAYLSDHHQPGGDADASISRSWSVPPA
jgi:hypothetical protein